MEEHKDKCGGCCGEGEGHGSCDSSCGYGFACYHRRYILVRWIFGLIILAIVFSVGVKVGELKSWLSFGDDYSSPMMSRYSGYRIMMPWGNDRQSYYGPAMMSGYPAAAEPGSPAKPTK